MTFLLGLPPLKNDARQAIVIDPNTIGDHYFDTLKT